MYKLSDYLIVSDPLNNKPGEVTRVMYATRTGMSSVVKDTVLQQLKRAEFAQIHPDTMQTLLQMEAVVPEGQDEFALILEKNKQLVAGSRLLEITIQPTANCQLDCGYCGQVHQKKNVDEETSKKITDRVINKLASGKFDSLMVQWYGGEPLMAYSEILRMSERLREYCSAHQIKYRAKMITNGMSFKPNVFINLLAQQVKRFQITLDGVAQTHDIMRITKEGKKSFSIILGNILDVVNTPEYMESDARISIRINVTKNTAAKGIYQLIDLLAEHRLYEKRVSLAFLPIFDWGGNGASKQGLTREEFAVAEIDWMLHAIKRGFGYKNLIPQPTRSPCSVVHPEAEVYDAFGNIFPCYEFPYTPAFDTPEYKIGHLDDAVESNNRHAVTMDWFEDVKTDISPCKRCALYPVCGGACPKQWHNNEIPCPSFKLNIKDKLVLDYLLRKGNLRERLLEREQKAA